MQRGFSPRYDKMSILFRLLHNLTLIYHFNLSLISN